MNRVFVSGMVLDKPFQLKKKGREIFFRTKISVKRNSGIEDIVSVILPEVLLPVEKGSEISIEGTYRSRNEEDGSLKNYILASVLREEKENKCNNLVEITGFLCKAPSYRSTPFGRKITDLFIVVESHYRRKSYIPCIAWGRNAEYANTLKAGDKIALSGRIQSREYQKGKFIRRVNEVSIQTIKKVKE